MKAHSLRVLALASIPALGAACADTGSGPTGPEVAIAVAPLTLPGIDEACFAITVYNGDPATLADGDPDNDADVVWSNDDICSVQYGNGQGDITYVGPCDASTGDNYVELVLDSLWANGAELDDEASPADFVNPCKDAGDCVQMVECLPNADSLVEFNLTVMRNAQQGFFDIVVNFEDIFCSAKLDSCYTEEQLIPKTLRLNDLITLYYYSYAGGEVGAYWLQDQWVIVDADATPLFEVSGEEGSPPLTFEAQGITFTLVQNRVQVPTTPIELLFGDDGREHTAVAAVACTAGAGSETDLVLSTPTVTCDNGVSFAINLSNEDGGNGEAYYPANATGTGIQHTLNFAVYFGEEQLTCPGPNGTTVSCGKVYYNIAFNLQALDDQGLSNCRLFYSATAVEAPQLGYDSSTTFDAAGYLSDVNGVYPAVRFNGTLGIPMTGGNGAPLCFAHGLNNTGSLVETGYIQGSGYAGSSGPYKADFHSGGDQASSFGGPRQDK
jgi:hypothetical protein